MTYSIELWEHEVDAQKTSPQAWGVKDFAESFLLVS